MEWEGENYGCDTRRRSTRSTAHLLRFLLFFTIAQSNVLSNAYLTVHRIGHTRVTAIAWRVIERFANISKRRHRILHAAVRRNLLLFLIGPPMRPNFPSPSCEFVSDIPACLRRNLFIFEWKFHSLHVLYPFDQLDFRNWRTFHAAKMAEVSEFCTFRSLLDTKLRIVLLQTKELAVRVCTPINKTVSSNIRFQWLWRHPQDPDSSLRATNKTIIARYVISLFSLRNIENNRVLRKNNMKNEEKAARGRRKRFPMAT